MTTNNKSANISRPIDSNIKDSSDIEAAVVRNSPLFPATEDCLSNFPSKSLNSRIKELKTKSKVKITGASCANNITSPYYLDGVSLSDTFILKPEKALPQTTNELCSPKTDSILFTDEELLDRQLNSSGYILEADPNLLSPISFGSTSNSFNTFGVGKSERHGMSPEMKLAFENHNQLRFKSSQMHIPLYTPPITEDLNSSLFSPQIQFPAASNIKI
jgi:hypothetical protein